MSMGVAAIIAGTGAVVGGVLGYVGSQNAANTEANASAAATAAEESMFNTEQQNDKPYITAGDNALGQINQDMSTWNQPFTMNDFENLSPEYGFDLSQGQQAITNSSAAQGGLVSGAELAALSNYTQNNALNAYDSAFNNYQTQINGAYSRLAGVAGMGAQVLGGQNGNATQVAGQVGNNITSAGNASAAGTIGATNAVTGALGSLGNTAMGYGMMNTILNSRNPSLPASGLAPAQEQQLGTPAGGFTMPANAFGATNSTAVLAGE